MATFYKIQILLFSFCLVFAKIADAQDNPQTPVEIGFGVHRYFSGSGLMAKNNPAIELHYGSKALSVGPLLRNEGMSGVLAMFKQELLMEVCNLKPYLFLSSSYNQGGKLKPSLANMLADAQDNTLSRTIDKYKVLEAYAGFGFTRSVFGSWYIDAGIGAGRYFTLNASGLGERPDDFLVVRPDQEFVLMYRGGLLYRF